MPHLTRLICLPASLLDLLRNMPKTGGLYWTFCAQGLCTISAGRTTLTTSSSTPGATRCTQAINTTSIQCPMRQIVQHCRPSNGRNMMPLALSDHIEYGYGRISARMAFNHIGIMLVTRHRDWYLALAELPSWSEHVGVKVHGCDGQAAKSKCLMLTWSVSMSSAMLCSARFIPQIVVYTPK